MYDTTPLLIFASGVVVADTTHQTKALEAINTFFGACSFAGHLCTPTSLYELGDLSVSPTGDLGSWGGQVHVGRSLGRSAEHFPPALFERALRIIGLASNDKEVALKLRLRHASAVHFMSGEHLQSFNLAWTVIEKSLDDIWVAFLREKQIEKKRLGRLIQPEPFSGYVITEVLNLCGKLSAESHTALQSLRRVRNNAMHKGHEPSQADTGKCIAEANGFLASTLKD